MFFKIGALKHFAVFRGKQCFFDKVAGLQLPVNVANFLFHKTPPVAASEKFPRKTKLEEV